MLEYFWGCEEMKIVGMICEYNPFHHGHLYHIQKIKEIFPDSLLVLVLNGYFLERGEISLLTKEDKTNIALEHGVDLVLELPVVFGTQAADIFAEKAIEILNHVGVTDVVFGSEHNDIQLLYKIAEIQLQPEFSLRVKKYLDSGVNYPTALSKALNLPNMIKEPNDLLGISYAKAILKHQYPIQLHTIQRTNSYHDITSTQVIVSASNIRSKIKNQEDISKYVPSGIPLLLQSYSDDFLYKLFTYQIMTNNALNVYETVDEGIENRLKEMVLRAKSLDEFIHLVKTKRYTYNRIRRMIIHILLGFTKEVNLKLHLDYLHILGFSIKGQEYLSKIRKQIEIPIKPIYSSKIYEFEKRAAFLYEILTNSSVQIFEKRNRPIIKKGN
ncbi:MAG: nucleotidyltransferase [Bacilli bacterium]|nr:nucleotidyltransferase [Bacilli bacterium]